MKRLIVVVVLLPAMLFAAKLEIGMSAGMHRVSSDIVTDFYDQAQMPIYGINVVLKPTKDFWGIYCRYARYRGSVDSPFDSYTYHFGKDLLAAGLQVDVFSVKDFILSARLGAGFHYDDLAFTSSGLIDTDRLGLNAGLMLSYPVGKKMFLNAELMYDREKESVCHYSTFAYSRHNAYLSGKTFDTGGFSLLVGISYELNVPFKRQ